MTVLIKSMHTSRSQHLHFLALFTTEDVHKYFAPSSSTNHLFSTMQFKSSSMHAQLDMTTFRFLYVDI